MSNHNDQQLIFDCLDLQNGNYSQDYPPEEMQIYQRSNWCQNQEIKGFCYQQRQNGGNKDFEKLKPTGLSDDVNQEKALQEQQLNHQQSIKQQKTTLRRDILCLQISQINAQKRLSSKKGQSYQTQNIGKHLKSITAKFLYMLNQAKFLDSFQKKAIDNFNISNGSIRDFQELFQVAGLRKICMDFYSSANYITWVMNSQKMDFYSKLMMIKYAQKLRSLTYTEVKGWKLQ